MVENGHAGRRRSIRRAIVAGKHRPFVDTSAVAHSRIAAEHPKRLPVRSLPAVRVHIDEAQVAGVACR